jgi:hypothetical protein
MKTWLGILFLLLTASLCPAATPIGFSSVAAEGVFDPSMADTPNGNTLWMCYSAVNFSVNYPVQNPRVETTRLAFSATGAAPWTDDSVIVNNVTEIPADPNERTWVNETCSLIYDPNAASTARWKLYWMHYAVEDGVSNFANGWIGYKEADTPADLQNSTEIKLLAGAAYNTANNTQGGTTNSPVGGAPVMTAAGFNISDCLAFSEPGGVANAAGVYVAMTCDTGTSSRVILFKCANPCTGSGSDYTLQGTILTSSQASTFGGSAFTASNLYFQGSTAYILVSSVSAVPYVGAYNGCFAFRFSNLDAASLVNVSNVPTLIVKIQGTPGAFRGACTFAQNDPVASGYLYGEFELSNPAAFQILIPPVLTFTHN